MEQTSIEEKKEVFKMRKSDFVLIIDHHGLPMSLYRGGMAYRLGSNYFFSQSLSHFPDEIEIIKTMTLPIDKGWSFVSEIKMISAEEGEKMILNKLFQHEKTNERYHDWRRLAF